jgi:hypothetical protein
LQQLSCSYFAGEKGRMPAKEFIDSLDPRSVAKFFYIKALLEEFGHRFNEEKYFSRNRKEAEHECKKN